MRILLVEDHLDSRVLLARKLRGDGHPVRAVETAAEALAACNEQAFDLILSDIALPDMSGWELLSRVRERQPVKAIALSAFGGPADLERSRAVGFDAHLIKPIDFQMLATTMAQLAG